MGLVKLANKIQLQSSFVKACRSKQGLCHFPPILQLTLWLMYSLVALWHLAECLEKCAVVALYFFSMKFMDCISFSEGNVSPSLGFLGFFGGGLGTFFSQFDPYLHYSEFHSPKQF